MDDWRLLVHIFQLCKVKIVKIICPETGICLCCRLLRPYLCKIVGYCLAKWFFFT